MKTREEILVLMQQRREETQGVTSNVAHLFRVKNPAWAMNYHEIASKYAQELFPERGDGWQAAFNDFLNNLKPATMIVNGSGYTKNFPTPNFRFPIAVTGRSKVIRREVEEANHLECVIGGELHWVDEFFVKL